MVGQHNLCMGTRNSGDINIDVSDSAGGGFFLTLICLATCPRSVCLIHFDQLKTAKHMAIC